MHGCPSKVKQYVGYKAVRISAQLVTIYWQHLSEAFKLDTKPARLEMTGLHGSALHTNAPKARVWIYYVAPTNITNTAKL